MVTYVSYVNVYKAQKIENKSIGESPINLLATFMIISIYGWLCTDFLAGTYEKIAFHCQLSDLGL